MTSRQDFDKLPVNTSIVSTSSTSSEAAAALLSLKKASLGVGPLTTPSKRRVNTKTGLIHGVLRVQKVRMNGRVTTRFEYLLENENDGTNIALLVAFNPSENSSSPKPKTPAEWMLSKRQFSIAQSDKQDHVIGQVSVAPFNNNVVAFSVTLLDQADMCILYKIQNAKTILTKNAPPRQVEVARFTERSKKAAAQKQNGPTSQPETNKFYRELLNQCCTYLQPNPEDAPFRVLCDTNYLSIFHSERPYIKIGNKTPTLNTRGRGRVTSSKNTQLVNSDGEVCIQVAKCDQETYHVDFGAPFNAFQAFAFGIAQVVL